MPVSVGTMQVTPIVIMQIPMSIAVMQVLTFYCNYVGDLSATVMLVDLFVAVMQVAVSGAIMQLE